MAWAIAAAVAALPAHAGELAITNAWSRTTPPGVTVGVAYFTLKNDTDRSDRLLKISTSVATKAQVHRTEILDGIARMREVAVLHVDAGQTLEFAPNGMHDMLTGLKQALVEGKTFEIEMLFERAGPRKVKVAVRKD
jgi:copper(I)-binding protein